MLNVIFDMDGVIFDTEALCLRCWKECAARYGQEVLRVVEPMFLRCVGTNARQTREIVAEVLGADFPHEEFLQAGSRRFHEIEAAEGLPLKPGIRELLLALQAAGARLGVASSTRLAAVEHELAEAGLRPFFHMVIGGDNVVYSKPNPEIYLLACEALGTQPEDTCAVEDSFNGIRAASAAGMRPIMVPDLLPPDEEMRQKAEIILPDLLAVRDYLLPALRETAATQTEQSPRAER